MESQQIVDYISDQLRAGHGEATLRQHLLEHGWTQQAVSQAFDSYNQRVMPKPSAIAAVKRHYHAHASKWTLARFTKLGVGFAVVAVLAVGGYTFWPRHQAVQASAPPPITYKQRQANDVNVIAGAIAQYASENSAIPISVSAAPDGNLVLCGVACDPTTSNVGNLGVYQASGVRFVAYDASLTAPDKATMYIVPGGSCVGQESLGAQSTKPRAVVILYAQDNGGDLAQRCVTL